jgi:hypothetical protein
MSFLLRLFEDLLFGLRSIMKRTRSNRSGTKGKKEGDKNIYPLW